MGKGDRKSRRGKIWRGTHGKARPRIIKKKYKLHIKPKEKTE